MRPSVRVLWLCVLAYFGTRVAQLVIAPVVPGIRASFAVSTGTIGAALTGMWVAYALAQVPSGVFSARVGERRVSLAALGVAGIGSLLLAASPNFAVFAASTVALGAGVGLYYNAGTTLLTGRFDGTDRVIGLHRIGGQAAGVVAPVTAAAIGTRVGWRAALLLGAAVAVPTFLLFARGVPTEGGGRETGEGGRETGGWPDPVALVRSGHPAFGRLTRPALVGMTLLAVLGEFVGMATASFLPTFLADFRGLSIGRAGALFSFYFLAVVAAQPAGGWAADRIGRRAATAASFLAGVAGYGLLVAGPPAVLVPGVVLAAAGMGWNAPVQASALSRLAGVERTGFGVFRTVYILLGALGSVVVGSVADLAGWAIAFGLLAGILLVGAAGMGVGAAGTLLAVARTLAGSRK